MIKSTRKVIKSTRKVIKSTRKVIKSTRKASTEQLELLCCIWSNASNAIDML